MKTKEELIEIMAIALHCQESGDKADWDRGVFEYTKEAYRVEAEAALTALCKALPEPTGKYSVGEHVSNDCPLETQELYNQLKGYGDE